MRIQPLGSNVYAIANVVDGEVVVKYYRDVEWVRQLPGKPGGAANRPPDLITAHITTVRLDVPFHVALNAVYDGLLVD